MATYWHVTSRPWDGRDLRSWHEQVEAGELTAADWRWTDAPVGMDGHGVCLFRARAEAEEYLALFGGSDLLRVEVPADARIETVAEGYPLVPHRVPAWWIERA